MKELIKKRRTVRKFKRTPLTREKLLSYVDSARVAPSAANMQALKYAVVYGKTAEKIFPLVKFAGYLPDYNPSFDEQPSAYIVICADTDIRKTGNDIDIGIAAEHIVLSALSDGVGSCLMGAIDREAIAKLLKLPENLTVSLVVALGYPDEEQKEAEFKGDIKYYLEDNVICVPKRSLKEILAGEYYE